MAFTQTQLDAIETAIASGELTVNFEGKSVTYRSMDDLVKARNLIKAELAAASSTAPSRVSYTSFEKD